MTYRFNDCDKYNAFLHYIDIVGASHKPSEDSLSSNFRFNLVLEDPREDQEAKVNSYYDYIRGI